MYQEWTDDSGKCSRQDEVWEVLTHSRETWDYACKYAIALDRHVLIDPGRS
jgi:hypothetical protein